VTFRSTLFRTLLVAGGFFAGLLIAEVALRLLNTPEPAISGWRAQLSPQEQNQIGFRGQRIEYQDDDFVIVLLGDSFTEAEACAYEWMPERRLESYLNASGKHVKVFSIGVAGYGQDQELLALGDYFEHFRADMVILWETPINDVWNNIFPTMFGKPKPTYWLENGQLRGPSEGIGQPLRENSRFKLIQLWSQKFSPPRDLLWEKYYPPAYKPMTEFKGQVKDDWQQLWDSSGAWRMTDIVSEKSPLAISLSPRSERMQYGLDLTRKLMQEIDGLTISHGAQFVAFAPNIFLDDLRNDGVHIFQGRYYRTSANQYKENLDYWNQGFKFFSIDVTVNQWRMGPENIHLNEHATDQVMKDLARQVQTLIPDRK
jgi:hypothetical protein